ncbi:MAG: sulfatase-like hydrolase/transferase [Verrucomicrobiales bacterium]
MRRLSRIFALVSLFLVPASLLAEKKQPNIVVFLADDAGWGDYSSSGNSQLATPHIDSLSRQGVTLENFLVCPLCAPTRAEFLTGRYFPRTGVTGVSTGRERLNLDEKTVADAFQSAGYATGAFGKWHNGSQWPYHPMARGFDTYFGHTSGHWGEYFDAPLEDEGRIVRTKGYIADVCTERALAFIEENQEKPFFCYIPFTTPHSPWSVPESYWQKFKNQKLSQHASDPKRENPGHTRCAYAMMENQDWNVGRVLEKLKTLGLSEDTIVLYFSDNGPNSHRWNGGLRNKKGSTDEGGVRSVCYLRWPAALPAGHRVPQISGAIDLLPTLTALAGIPRVGQKPLDGADLSPLLKQEERAAAWPARLLFSTWPTKTSVRSQSHRLDAAGRLYDLRNDPGQTTPVNEKEPELAARLKRAARDHRHEVLGLPADAPLQKNFPWPTDERPLEVGHREFPVTQLPARDGTAHGQAKRSASAPNSSYFVNWKSTEDHLDWAIKIATPGRYRIDLAYTCAEGNEGAEIELSFREAKLSGRVPEAWDPPLYDNQDTLPRPPAESLMKPFKTFTLGETQLPAGEGILRLRATDIPGEGVIDLRRLTFTLLPD